MKLARQISIFLTFLGIVLYSPPVSHWFLAAWGRIGELQGVVIFAVGWAFLLADMVFHLGKESENKVRETE